MEVQHSKAYVASNKSRAYREGKETLIMEHLYPDVARELMPHIDEIIHTYGTDMSEDNIERMTHDLAQRGMVGGTPPRGHTQSTLNDLARLLILQRMFEQGFVPIFPYSPFFFFPPFVPIHRPPVRPPHHRPSIRPPVHPIRPRPPVRPPVHPVRPIAPIRPMPPMRPR